MSSGTPFYDEQDLTRARRLNRFLQLLPRYRPDRRWNARLLQTVIVAGQYCVPDFAVIRRKAYISKPNTGNFPVKLRVTLPKGDPQGAYLHFHGGAWVVGNARLDDGIARPIARECGVLVAAVDFRNARDDRLDATLGECNAAAEWLVDHLEDLAVDRVVLGGESSGAYLAVEALLHLRSASKLASVAGFVSICGAFDLRGSESLRRAPRRSLLISGPSALNNLRRLSPSLPKRLSSGPLYADLKGLPPALFVSGSLDPIVDDSQEMWRAWSEENHNATCVIVPEAPHGFNRLPTTLASKTNRFARDWIRQAVSAANPRR